MSEVFTEVHRLLTSDHLIGNIFKFSLVFLGFILSLRFLMCLFYDRPFVDFSPVWFWLAAKLKVLAIKLFGMERLISWGLAEYFVDFVDCDSVGDCTNCPFEEYCTDEFIKDFEDPAEPVK